MELLISRALLLLVLIFGLVKAELYTVSGIPDYSPGDTVEIYFLETPFPSTVPASIQVSNTI
jgi:hypothetical protein